MTNLFTIFDANSNSTTAIEHADRAEALRLVAIDLIARLDRAGDVQRLNDCIDEGRILTTGHKAPEPVLLAENAKRFWFAVATAATTDNVEFFEGDRAPWEEGA